MQPCVSFNKVNTFAWYKQRCYTLPADHDPADFGQAMNRALESGDKIPLGVIARNDRPSFESLIPGLKPGPLAGRKPDLAGLTKVLESYA
jgi:2-oxoglutarate ferredoxin oxidoreductase subunit beta